MKWTLSLLLFSLPLSLSLGAEQILLNDVMTQEEQVKTGVSKLSPTQKIELENWLNYNFILKKDSHSKERHLSLSINIDNGQKLQLSDNSIWEIAPSDVNTAAVWITPFPVTITKSSNPNYPYLITNTTSGESVQARKWEPQRPPKPAPSPRSKQ